EKGSIPLSFNAGPVSGASRAVISSLGWQFSFGALHGLHLAIADAVCEINDKADQEPAEHNLLGEPRKRVDKIERRDNPEDRNDGNEGRAERSLHFRSATPQNPD